MNQNEEYLAVLRCRSWNVWPERLGAEYRQLAIDYGASTPLDARLIVVSYLENSSVERYDQEKTTLGPLIWNGAVPGVHRVRNEILKAPEDEIEIALEYRNACRGEIDIFLNFKFSGELPPELLEALRATTFSVMALINLQLDDFLIASGDFQVRGVLNKAEWQLETAVTVAVKKRTQISQDILETTVKSIAQILNHSIYGLKMRTAMELYSAHFNESQVRVRFLLLVIGMESLTEATEKHDVAGYLLDSWKGELENEISKYAVDSQEWLSLDALKRELNFRAHDSLRSQIRKLFLNLSSLTLEDSLNMQKRALKVYDKRSVLVHDGRLSDSELHDLEQEARELLEALILDQIKHAHH